MKIDFNKYEKILDKVDTIKMIGKVIRVVGLIIESIGPLVQLGEHCYIIIQETGVKIDAEVVGFNDDKVLLMPLGEMKGIGYGCEVDRKSVV